MQLIILNNKIDESICYLKKELDIFGKKLKTQIFATCEDFNLITFN